MVARSTPSDGTVQVGIQQRGDGFVQICVADTGCGIEAAHLPKVLGRPCHVFCTAWKFFRCISSPGPGILTLSRTLRLLHT